MADRSGPDITYVPTWEGFLYLSVVRDVWTRRIIGWTMASHLRTELVLEALDMALRQRCPIDVIHHSDHGCQCTASSRSSTYPLRGSPDRVESPGEWIPGGCDASNPTEIVDPARSREDVFPRPPVSERVSCPCPETQGLFKNESPRPSTEAGRLH
ncbi:MAG: DDE-type integrase/transposase/recombinase [Candidatus Eisenbacteria sp.]|nr:DDE-type integrase/transposase/recombinase [Candidatus Eisenbacteria bacterium]